MAEFVDGGWLDESSDSVGGEPSPPSEVAKVDGFDPCGYDRIAHGGMVELDELLGVAAFVDVVGLWLWESYCLIGGNNGVAVVGDEGDSPETCRGIPPPSQDDFTVE